jgi:lipid-binding SYLF domain-containing protein
MDQGLSPSEARSGKSLGTRLRWITNVLKFGHYLSGEIGQSLFRIRS